MAFAVPIPLKPRHIVTCTLYGGNAGSTGSVTWGSGVDIGSKSGTAAFDSFDIDPKAVTTDVTPTDAVVKVNLPSQVDVTGSVGEIQASDGSTALSAIAATYDFIKIIALYRPEGASSGGTYRAVIGTVSDGHADFNNVTGKNVWKMNLVCAGATYYEGPTLPTLFS